MSAPRIVYEDDLVQLWHGDYREGISNIAPGSVDVIVTDPPYGDTNLTWDRWPAGWVKDAQRLTDALWCFGSFRMFHEHSADFADWKYSQDVIWEKHNGTGLLNDRFRRIHEHAVLWYRGDWADIRHVTPTTPDAVRRTAHRSHKPAHLHGERGSTTFVSERGGPRLMRSIIHARNEHHRAIHPTQKPLGILSPLIEYSAPPWRSRSRPLRGLRLRRARSAQRRSPLCVIRSRRGIRDGSRAASLAAGLRLQRFRGACIR